jgi:arginine exporter protein ArgO
MPLILNALSAKQERRQNGSAFHCYHYNKDSGGAILASCTRFFGLAYGAAWLAPLFRRPLAWRVLDSIVGCIMWTIAASLIWAALRHETI